MCGTADVPLKFIARIRDRVVSEIEAGRKSTDVDELSVVKVDSDE